MGNPVCMIFCSVLKVTITIKTNSIYISTTILSLKNLNKTDDVQSEKGFKKNMLQLVHMNNAWVATISLCAKYSNTVM